jgi:DNA-damage-inducible protein D
MPEALSIISDNFEQSAKDNGFTYWLAHDLMAKLGYQTYDSFMRVINKAIASCAQLNISVADNFEATVFTNKEGETISSFKLTRFACFLVIMHADAKKPEVQQHKVFFAALAESLLKTKLGQDALERIELREELADGEKGLSSVAKEAGLLNYAFFKDAGYRGMYNMRLSELLHFKGLKRGDKLYDRLGKTELAAHWFRVTQTAEKIRSTGVRGQDALERTAHAVGRQVRDTMVANSGTPPELLRVDEHINQVKRKLKTTHKELKRLDKHAE